METAVQKRQAAADPGVLPLILRPRPAIELTENQFFELCRLNRELRIERNAAGDLLIMPPAGSETGGRNSNIAWQLVDWSRKDGSGVTFDSSAGFTLPNGAVRSPDAAWIERSRWERLPREQRDRFAPICPDFVLELRSPSDALRDLQAKMQEYLDNGARLGWLLDPEPRHAYVYIPGVPVERLDDPATLSGGEVLPGFVLDLAEIW